MGPATGAAAAPVVKAREDIAAFAVPRSVPAHVLGGKLFKNKSTPVPEQLELKWLETHACYADPHNCKHMYTYRTYGKRGIASTAQEPADEIQEHMSQREIDILNRGEATNTF